MMSFRTIKICWLVILSFACGVSYSQISVPENRKIIKLFEEAKMAYQKGQNAQSVNFLDQILQIDPGYLDAYLMKSDIYQETDSVALQHKALLAALKINPEKQPKLYYLLGKTSYRMGLYRDAYEAFNNYLARTDEKAPFYANAKNGLEKCTNALSLLTHPVEFKCVNLGDAINSDDDEYWPSLTVDGNTLIFTRLVGARKSDLNRRVMAQEDFYTSTKVDGVWTPSKPLVGLNTDYNEGAQSVSTDGKLIFFTACTRSDGYGSCDIYFSRNRNGVWSTPQNAGAPVNSSAWESQPSISANGETLYFVSNRPGGKGGMDIWKCDLKGFSEGGKPDWSTPVNLGDSINTPGNEISPFIHSDGKTLYFASDFWPGLGGYDIFYSRQKKDNQWTRPRNMGYPINTYKDEQGLVVDAAGKNAYYSSDRPGSKGMDIYSFELYKGARPGPVSYIKGKVVDEDSGQPLCAKVELIDVENPKSVIKSESCWDKGEFVMCLPLGKEYAFNVSKEGYLFYSENFELKEKTDIIDPYILDIKLKKIKVGGFVVLKNVFFETDSYELKPESKAELQKLIEFLNQNPTVAIEISGHTDTVGTEDYNLKLSKSRAEAVYNYLIDNNIDAARMTYAGYGFSKPMSTNDTPEGRALNRRTEFRVVRK